MTAPSPPDDAVSAARLWARHRRLMRLLLLTTVAIVAGGIKLLLRHGANASAHRLVTAAVLMAFVMLALTGWLGLASLRHRLHRQRKGAGAARPDAASDQPG